MIRVLTVLLLAGGFAACGEDIDPKFEDCESFRLCQEDPVCDPGPLLEIECDE